VHAAVARSVRELSPNQRCRIPGVVEALDAGTQVGWVELDLENAAARGHDEAPVDIDVDVNVAA
jgi:hypothetical protein